MYFKISTDYKLIENIIKIPDIYDSVNPTGRIPSSNFYIPDNTDKVFLIGYIANRPAALIVSDQPRVRTHAHFLVIPEYRHSSTLLYFTGIEELKKQFPVIKKLIGQIPLKNERALKFYKKTGSKVIGFKDDNYQMELEIKEWVI